VIRAKVAEQTGSAIRSLRRRKEDRLAKALKSSQRSASLDGIEKASWWVTNKKKKEC